MAENNSENQELRLPYQQEADPSDDALSPSGPVADPSAAPTGDECSIGAIYQRSNQFSQDGIAELGAQAEKNLAHAGRHHVNIPDGHILHDVASGIDPDRRGFLSLSRLVVNGAVGHVFVCAPDRLSRDTLQPVELSSGCAKDNHVQLHFARMAGPAIFPRSLEDSSCNVEPKTG